MPLHINLLHEQQSLVTERKRDPLKLGILAMLLVAMGFYGYYLLKSVGAGRAATEKAELEQQYAKIAPQAAKAKEDLTVANQTVDTTAVVENLINGRFYWGPLFTDFVAGIAPEIQITSFQGSNRSAGGITLTVVGVSAGREPRAVAEEFRQSMEKRLGDTYGTASSQFVSLENSDTPLILAGKTYATANFSIGFQLTLKSK